MTTESGLETAFPMPKQVVPLRFLVGTWRVEGTLATHGSSFALRGTVEFYPAAAGWGILILNKLHIEGLGWYEEVAILGYNSDDGQVHFFSLTNTGAANDHKGSWRDATNLELLYESQQRGRPYREVVLLSVLGPNELTIHEVDTIAGQPETTMSVALCRVDWSVPARYKDPANRQHASTRLPYLSRG